MSLPSHDPHLIHGDCLDVMETMAEQSVDMILTDFPYGVLNPRNRWDVVPDLKRVWAMFRRIIKPNTVIISTAKQPFTSKLILSNEDDFRYTMVWEKSKATGYLNARKRPMVAHEDIVVFYHAQAVYNPQMTNGFPYDKGTAVRDTECYAKQTKAIHVKCTNGKRYPRSVQYFRTAECEGKLHPTQKPIALLEWLLKTYTNQQAVVLDPFMGSGSTGLAALRQNRKFIGIEADEKYFMEAKRRLTDETPLLKVANANGRMSP